MNNQRTPVLIPVSEQTSLDTVVEVVMGVLLFFAPLAFGTTQAWSQEILFVLVAALTACLGVRLVIGHFHNAVWSSAFLPIGLFLLLVTIQLVPLPAAMLSTFSPGTVRLRESLLGVTSLTAGNGSSRISFYAFATRQQLRLVIAIAALFAVVLHFYRDPARIRRLLFTIAGIGLLVALFAIYQNISGTDSIYGVVKAIHRNSGPFMNYSHFSQFMNLSIGAGLGLLLTKIAELSKGRRDVGATFHRLADPRQWPAWILIALCVLGPLAIFLSMSRMGMISFVASLAITSVLLALRSRIAGQATIPVGIGIILLAVLLCVGFDATYDRLATLRHVQHFDGGRLQMLKDMSVEIRTFPLLGTGLGTHEFVFPMYDHSAITEIASHAENEFAQILEECGSLGLAAAMWFIAIVAASYAAIVWNPKEPLQYAAFGLGGGLLAILIHSFSDFGQHVPANAALTAISAALIINLRARGTEKSSTRQNAIAGRRYQFVGWSIGLACFILVGATWTWVIFRADKDRLAESTWLAAEDARVTLQNARWHVTTADFVSLLSPAAKAASLAPDNVVYGYWLNLYRWMAISQQQDQKTGRVLISPQGETFVNRIVGQLHAVHQLCPTFGPPVSLAGQLELFVLNQPRGATDIETGYQLTPYDSISSGVMAQLAVRQCNWPLSLAAFRRSIALGGSARQAIDDYVRTASHPDLAYQIASGNRDSLNYLAGLLEVPGASAIDVQLANRCREEAGSLLEEEAATPEATAEVMASLADHYASLGKSTLAIDWYRKSLARDYDQVDVRLRLANALATAGDASQAMREARVCLNLRPQSKEAEAMISDLSVRANVDRD